MLTLSSNEIDDSDASTTADLTAMVNVTVAAASDNDADDATYVVSVSAPSMRNVYDGRPSVAVTVTVVAGEITGTSVDW